MRERLEVAAGEGDAKARLASVRSELEAVSLERDALVSRARFPLTVALLFLTLPCLALRFAVQVCVSTMIGCTQGSQARHRQLECFSHDFRAG